MKFVRNFPTYLIIFLTLSSLMLGKSYKNNKNDFSRIKTKTNMGVETKTCENGWGYFLSGMFYNGAVDSLNKLSIFKGTSIEKCVDNSLSTIYNLMKNWNQKSKDFEEKQAGKISKCLGTICWLAKKTTQFVTATLVSGVLKKYAPEAVTISDLSQVFKATYDGTGLAMDKLTSFWKEKAAPYIEPVVEFIKHFSLSDIIYNLFACVGRDKLVEFFSQMGLKLINYFEDNLLTTIGETVLTGAEKFLNQYHAINDNPIEGPVLDTLEIVSLFSPADSPKKTVGQVVFRKIAQKEMRKLASLNLFRIVKGSLGYISNFAKIAYLGYEILKKIHPEMGWLIYNLIRDIRNLTLENDECKRSALWGKITYKCLRLTKSFFFGSGFFGAADKGYKLTTKKESQIIEEAFNNGIFN